MFEPFFVRALAAGIGLALIAAPLRLPPVIDSVLGDVLHANRTMAMVAMDFDGLRAVGSGLGTAGVIVMDKSTDLIKAIARLSKFYMHESCGQCTPCRVGTQKAATLMENKVWNRGLLDELSQAMRDASICGLGQAASNPLTTVIKYFPEEFAPKEAAE